MKRVLLLATQNDDVKIFLWCLRQAKGYDCYVVGHEEKNPEIKYSLLCKKFFDVPKEWTLEDKSIELIGLLKEIIQEHNIEVLLPTGFESIKYLSHYKGEVEKFIPLISLPDEKSIDELGNKAQFAKYCESNSIPHPKVYHLQSYKQYKSIERTVNFPIVTKPIISSASRGIYKFDECEKLDEYFQKELTKNKTVFPILLQEYIPGEDYGFCAYTTNGIINAWTIMRFIEIPRNGNKPLLWIKFQRNDDIYEIGKDIVGKSNYSGPINIDMRVKKDNGSVYAIEVNTRFWARTFISLCDGVNFPDIAIRGIVDKKLKGEPKYSNKIWGSPHWALIYALTKRKKQYLYFASRHTLFQIRYFIFDKWYSFISRLRRKFKDIGQTCLIYKNDYGRWNLVLKLILKACPVFTYYETIQYKCNLQSLGEKSILPKVNLTFEELNEKDYAAITQIKDPDDPGFIKKRLELGEQCYVAKENNEICSYLWVAPGIRDVEHEARVLHIPNAQIYIHDCFTVEQYRGKRILPCMLNHICIQMKAKGYKDAMAVVYNDNYPSRRCFEKIAFQKWELTRHFVLPYINKKYYYRKMLL